jgi:NADH:ubiquinone oxidoreductase subunit B-like Fe-S oxidoreductase
MTVAQQTPMSRLVNWARAKSLWIFPFGGCACAAADRSARSQVQAGGFYDTYTQYKISAASCRWPASVPGCPPRIEDLIDAIDGLQRKISRNG